MVVKLEFNKRFYYIIFVIAISIFVILHSAYSKKNGTKDAFYEFKCGTFASPEVKKEVLKFILGENYELLSNDTLRPALPYSHPSWKGNYLLHTRGMREGIAQV